MPTQGILHIRQALLGQLRLILSKEERHQGEMATCGRRLSLDGSIEGFDGFVWFVLGEQNTGFERIGVRLFRRSWQRKGKVKLFQGTRKVTTDGFHPGYASPGPNILGIARHSG